MIQKIIKFCIDGADTRLNDLFKRQIHSFCSPQLFRIRYLNPLYLKTISLLFYQLLSFAFHDLKGVSVMAKNKRHFQYSLLNTNHQHKFSAGGALRSKKLGRGQRPLSCKEPLHLVFKVNQMRLRHKTLRSYQGFRLINKIMKKYSAKFYTQIEQISIQNDHLHLLIRTKRRSQFHSFFRVVAGQIAQIFQKEGLLLGKMLDQRMTDTPKNGTQLWKYRPFTRVVRGYKAYKIVKNYIQLNEKEIRGEVKYSASRLKGLLPNEWEILWS